jgi:tRNA(fMet)-specific endonuclease VapC
VTARYLLDTNIISYAIKGQHPAVDRRLKRAARDHLAVSAITEGELRYGLSRRPEARRLRHLTEEFLTRTTILAWDSAAAQAYGDLRTHLEAKGETAAGFDLLIAAHALSSGLILVTHDQVFSRIKKLRVEDWTR